MYAKVAWARVVTYFKLNKYSAKALLEYFDDTWGVGNTLCRRDRMKASWNWKDMVVGNESIS